jgi:sulfonate transport system substrate-binding protein
MKRLSNWLSLLVLTLLTFSSAVALGDAPKVIRIAYPGVGIGNRPAVSGNAVATMHLKGLLEQEFKADGIEIRWSFLRGAGPAVNELYANGLIDFSALGDLPSVIGRAGGLKTKVLAGTFVRGNLYFSVPSDSNIKSIKDLRGKKIAVLKGTATQLGAVKVLESFGLQEKDVRLINMDTNTAKAAIITKDVDAAVGGYDYLALREQGVARVIYTTKGADPNLTSNTLFLGSDAFIQKYPEHTTRVLKCLVLAAKWLADNEKEPAPVYQLWTKSGFTFASIKEDYTGESLKYRTSPLLDSYLSARYGLQISETKRFGLSRSTFSFQEWLEPRFLDAALKELHLENFWQPRDAKGTAAS